MSTSTDPSPLQQSSKNSPHTAVDMRPSRFELTSGFFLTLILFMGVIVSMMFLLWTLNRWASQTEIHHSPPVRTTFVDAGERGSESDFDTPSGKEVQELTTPSVQESLISVTDAAGKTAMTLHQLDDFPTRKSGHGVSKIITYIDEDIVPRSERWQLNFGAADRANYASQLDHFGIELGVIGGGIQGVDVVGQLSTHPHIHRLLDTKKEKRLYFMWTTASRLRDFEHDMLTQVGVDVKDRVVIRFITSDLENQLAHSELEFAIEAGHKSVTEIAKTVFQSVPVDDGFEFRIIDQRYR